MACAPSPPGSWAWILSSWARILDFPAWILGSQAWILGSRGGTLQEGEAAGGSLGTPWAPGGCLDFSKIAPGGQGLMVLAEPFVWPLEH